MPQSKAQREWYERNKAKQIREVHEKRAQIKATVSQYKAAHGCQRCPENDPGCLEFHHLVPGAKEFSIAVGMRRGYGAARLKAEMEKCVVLCANCHRKEHAAQVD